MIGVMLKILQTQLFGLRLNDILRYVSLGKIIKVSLSRWKLVAGCVHSAVLSNIDWMNYELESLNVA